MTQYKGAARFILAKTSRNVAFFVWLCHIAIAFFFCDRAIEHGLTGYYWAAALLLVCSIPYLLATIRNDFIPFEGIYLFLGGIIVGFTAYLFLPVNEIDLDPKSWEYAMKLATMGSSAFLLGYWTVFGRSISRALPLRRFIISNRNLMKLPPKLYLIGWALRISPIFLSAAVELFERIGIIGMPLKVLQKMQGWEISSMLVTYGICAGLLIDAYLYLIYFKENPRKRQRRNIFSRLTLLFLAEIIYGFFSGMAGPVIRPVILLLLVYIKAKNKMPIFVIAIVLSLFIFFAVPFIKSFRELYWYGNTTKISVQHAVSEVSDKEKLSNMQKATLKRLSNPLEMAIISYDTRKEGRAVKTYEDLPGYLSRFLPRFLWPNKPIVDYNRIGRELGILGQEDYTTAVSLTLVGGLIMDNGTYGVLIGMFIAGIIVSVLWNWLVVRAGGNMLAFVIYAILIYRWVFPDDFYAVFHSMVSFVIYAYLLVTFINRGYYKPIKTVSQA